MRHSSPSLCAVLVIVAITLCSSLIAVELATARPPVNETTAEPKTDATADAAVLNIKTRQQVKVDGTQEYWCPTITGESLTGQPPFHFRRTEN